MTHYSRRSVLKMVGLVTAAGATVQLWPLSPLNAAPSDAVPASLDDFLQVSRALTQQDELYPQVAHALLVALGSTEKNFTAGLAQLKNLLQGQPALLQQDKLAFAKEDAASEKLAKAILGGWYNGMVGKGEHALYVTYINTLSNQLVRAKLVPPSFSYGPCGSWARQP